MKKTYIQPQMEIAEVETHKVIMSSLTTGDDITSGSVPADAPDFNFDGWFNE